MLPVLDSFGFALNLLAHLTPSLSVQANAGSSEPLGFSSLLALLFSKESLFALSLFPYLGFLWFLTRSPQTPRLALVGFYMTLLFVGVTIPVGLYAQTAYGKALADVDLLHGGAEFFLTLANVLIVLGFRQALLQQKSQTG
jgi:hypothetical protein